MNNVQIECFITIAKMLNFTKASEVLSMTQPSLSKNIASLEREVGVKLLMRNRRKVELTPAGEAFLADMTEMLGIYEKAVQKANNIGHGIDGVVKLGFIGTASTGILPDIVSRFKKRYPRVTLKLKDYTYSSLAAALGTGEVDVAFILDADIEHIPQIVKETLYTDAMCAVMNGSHPLSGCLELDLRQLKDETFIMMDRRISAKDNELVNSICQKHGFLPQETHEVSVLHSLLLMVECDAGVSVLAEHMRQFAPPAVKFVRIKGYERFFKFVAAYRPGMNPCAEKLLSAARGGKL